MAVNNATILAKAWLEGSNDFMQRIPDPTQAGVKATIDALFDPMNKQYFNQFQDYLINRIAYTYVHGKVFDNPLAEFKKQKIDYGGSIQNIAFKWLKAHSYLDDDETLLKMERPDGVAWYVSQNRRDRYDLSISRDELRTAVNEEFGLNNLVARMMELPINSDNYDEFQIMKNLFAIYETSYGFHRHKLSSAPIDEASGKEFLSAVMADSGYMKFPSTVYNADTFKDIPTFVTDDELILICTPTTYANVNVQTYAGLFNMDVAKAQARIIQVDNIPIPNAVAILTTRDLWDCHDTVFEMDTFWNPQTRTNKQFLHHWGIYGVNPYVPAVLYTTDEVSPISVVTEKVTGMKIEPSTKTAALGDKVVLKTTLQGSISPETDGIEVKPNAATYALTLTAAEGDSDSALKSTTRVDEYGVLHIQKTGLKAGSVINVMAASTYFNPTTQEDTRFTASATITIE